mmetsp:Transcript_29692/g.95429  ORF Transcript_29692/g.95429 Transcript_29692/m.95429 type:complete len:336 (-) Transcript_29692:797-1804(-)
MSSCTLGFLRVKKPKVTSYNPGVVVTMFTLSRSQKKLSGSVLTLCTFQGTPPPALARPLFQIQRPTLLSVQREALMMDCSRTERRSCSSGALASISRLISSSAALTSSTLALTSSSAHMSRASTLSASSSRDTPSRHICSRRSRALFTAMMLALWERASFTWLMSALRSRHRRSSPSSTLMAMLSVTPSSCATRNSTASVPRRRPSSPASRDAAAARTSSTARRSEEDARRTASEEDSATSSRRPATASSMSAFPALPASSCPMACSFWLSRLSTSAPSTLPSIARPTSTMLALASRRAITSSVSALALSSARSSRMVRSCSDLWMEMSSTTPSI